LGAFDFLDPFAPPNWVYTDATQTNVEIKNTECQYTDDYNAALVTLTKYPDGSTSGSDNVQITYNLDGTPATRTDQRGVVHTYTYDSARRLLRGGATTIPSGVVFRFGPVRKGVS
jgi:YD repeat-containing protein